MQILVVGLNPAVDVEWRVASIHWDEKNTVQGERRWAGGKSVNVARWLRHLGAPVKLLVPLGGHTGVELRRQLRAEGVALRAVPIREATRANVMVTPERGPQLRFNPRGPKLSAAEWRAFFRAAERELKRSAIVILSGALCREARPTVYRDLVRLAHRLGVRVVLDCDGPAFAAGVRAKPLLVKPNEFELAQWAGRKLRSEAAVVRAARELSRCSGGWVLLSRDARGGLLVNAGEDFAWQAAVPRVRVRNTVGAGDALLAAAAVAMTNAVEPAGWLRAGLSTATAAVQCPAGELAAPGVVAKVRRRIHVRPV
ncbi:MAG: 1-phosphofructokinase family hexose kinase [Limisphaerales bacterium]